MTGQISDAFRFQDHDYAIVGISDPNSWFKPSRLRIKPESPNTACWRGFAARFAILSAHLVLDELHVFLAGKDYAPKKGPSIKGVKPMGRSGENDWFNNHYLGLAYPLDYTGSLLLGDGFIQGLYVHMGVQSSWKFNKVLELDFQEGVLIEEHDRSEQMAEIRKQNVQREAEHDGSPREHHWPDDTIFF